MSLSQSLPGLHAQPVDPSLAAWRAQVTESLGVPRVYIKLLVELEDFLNKSLADKVGRSSSH